MTAFDWLLQPFRSIARAFAKPRRLLVSACVAQYPVLQALGLAMSSSSLWQGKAAYSAWKRYRMRKPS